MSGKESQKEWQLAVFLAVIVLLSSLFFWFRQHQRIDSLEKTVVEEENLTLSEKLQLRKESIALRNSANSTLFQTLGGAFFFATAFISWLNYRATQQKQITERFSKSVEQLNSEDSGVCIGGIFSLERVAYDSPSDHWTIMEVLTVWVREKSRATQSTNMDSAIQAAITVIGRRNKDLDQSSRKIDLSNSTLRNILLANTYFAGARFREADLQGAKFWKAILNGADFSIDYSKFDLRDHFAGEPTFENNIKEEVRQKKIFGANLSAADLYNAQLNQANLNGAILTRANLTKASLYESSLMLANFQEAVLRKADLNKSNLAEAILSKANFRDATLIGANLFKAHLDETDFENANLGRANLMEVDLTKSKISGAIFKKAIYSNTTKLPVDFDPTVHQMYQILPGSDLKNADLEGVILRGADLSGANLFGANLCDADLRGANLTGVDFTKSNLERAKLNEAIIEGANLEKARKKGMTMPDGTVCEK